MHPSSSSSRRLNTVHDLAALRIHRDGSRVQNSDANFSSRRAKYSVRDARGNWIARDAGGLGNVKQRWSAPQSNEDQEDEDEPVEDAWPALNKGKDRARGSGDEEEEVALSRKAQKRMKFDEDLRYLDSGASQTSLPEFQGEHTQVLPGASPVPSSDLLKCLHYFASTYYTSMGQLYDASRESRMQRKIDRVAKLKDPATSSRAPSETPTVDEAPRSSSLAAVDSGGESDSDPQGEAGELDGAEITRGKKKKGRRRLSPTEKDMYKILDGSALIALGMLLQEHIAEILEPKIPAEWEKEMDRYQRAETRRARTTAKTREGRHLAKGQSQGEFNDAQEERKSDMSTEEVGREDSQV